MTTSLALAADILFVSADAEPISNGVLLVQDGRVAWVGPRKQMPDFDGTWLPWQPPVLVPGLIDAHSHLSIITPGDEFGQLKSSEAQLALRAAAWADRNLSAGVVAMRLLGEPRGLEQAYMEAAQAAPSQWPCLESAGPAIRPAKGAVSVADAIVDSEVEARRWVKRVAEQGFRWLKFHATPSSLRGNPTESLYSREMINTLISEAHRANLRVAVHCHGGEAADACINAGVDTVEHGRWLSDSQLKKMAREGIALVTTVGIVALARTRHTGDSPETLLEEIAECAGRAREFGVRVLPGTDAVHGRLHLELEALRAVGFSPSEVFYQATISAAEVCHFPELGSLEHGKRACAVGLEMNPLENVEAWRTVCGVFHNDRLIWPQPKAETSSKRNRR